MYARAEEIIEKYRPDVLHVGAFSQLGPFVETAHKHDIPVVAMVHAYSWLCLTKFLINDANLPCNGPETVLKCVGCLRCQLSQKRQLASRSFQLLSKASLHGLIPRELSYRLDVDARVREAFDYMARLRNLVDAFIAQSPMTAALLRKYGVPEQNVELVGQWLVEEKLRKYPKETHGQETRLRIGFIGRLSAEKGLGVLGEALRLMPSLSEIELWVLSSRATLAILEQFMGRIPKKLGIRIRIFDNLTSNEALAKTIAQLDMCVVPSTCRETGPRVLLEAIAQKVPCVASDCVGNSYLITDKVNGRLVEAGDARGLASVICEVLNAPEELEAWRSALPSVMGETDWLDMVMAVHEKVAFGRSGGHYEEQVI